MEWVRSAFACGFLFYSFLFSANAALSAANQSIESVASAIATATGQARLSLAAGIFRTKRGTTEFRLEVPENMESTLKFSFDNDALLSASWAFQKEIFVEVRTGGKCVRLRVKRFEYEEGGFLGGNSEQTIVPSGPCRESEPLSRLSDFLRLSTEAADFFRGHVFVSLDDLERCRSSSCDATSAGLPIRKAVFYSAAGSPGLLVKFRPEASIVLPNSSFLVLAANSGALVKDLSYDLEADAGNASLSEVKLHLTDGVIVGGDTILRVAPGTELVASGFFIEKDEGLVRVDGGRLSGRLGQGTSILLSRDEEKRSTLNILSASATLVGLNYESSGGQTSLSILRGQLGVRIEAAELWLSDRNSLRFGYTTADLTLGCPVDTAEGQCTPVEWSNEGIQLTGTVTNLATALNGGMFNLTNVGQVQLLSGQVVADRLEIDTTDPKSPVTGTLNKFEVSLQGQDLEFDESTSARIATAKVEATDIVYRQGQTLPIGSVRIGGTIERLTGGELKEVGFAAGAAFELTVERKDGDDPAIIDGRIDGDVSVTMSGGNNAQAKIVARDLRYYRGMGDGFLTLSVTNATYSFATPPDRKTERQFPLSAEIDVKSITLAPTLARPLTVGPTRIRSFGKSWRIDPVRGAEFEIRLPIARQELVYAPIKTDIGGTVCAPKVMLEEQTQTISGKFDLFASDTRNGIRIYENNLSPGVLSKVEDRGCSDVGKMVCAVIGGAFGGPIGAAALATICGGEIEEEKQKLSDRIRDESLKKVAEADFRFGI